MRVVGEGERPAWGDVKNVSDSLRRLVEDCWRADPVSRPEFSEIVERLDECFFEAVIPNRRARQFWRKSFRSEFFGGGENKTKRRVESPADAVSWDAFEERLVASFLAACRKKYSPTDFDVRVAVVKELIESQQQGDRVTPKAWGQLCEWFGPLDSPDSPDSRRDRDPGHALLENMFDIVSHSWFFGAKSADEARRSVMNGSYLIRFSGSTFGAFVLTRGKRDPKNKRKPVECTHQTIMRRGEKFVFVKTGSEADSLPLIVKMLKKKLGLRKTAEGSRFGKTFLATVTRELVAGDPDPNGGYEDLSDSELAPAKDETATHTPSDGRYDDHEE
jgi:SH2 domain